ncbi:MAG: MMPL family transporter [Candidatus Thalassarchaeaceae archaeon]|nr:MMPL family transporter [Candidatus Thalassarchaeaceae archaeon]MDP7003697.1 MMPL family transporter [Candidatus Thalassarchaeaceae archaeon]
MTGTLREDELDDEARFWEWFFESLQPARNAIVRAREAVYGGVLGGALDTVGQLSDDVSDGVHAVAQRAAELTYSGIQRSPGAVVALLLLLTALIGRDAMDFEHQINGDVEIYLPDGANSTVLLNEVREQWATDIVILYVQTDNAATGGEKGNENITDVDILSQMSWIEGDDNNVGKGGLKSGLDYNKEDRGSLACNKPGDGCDGVIWVLSPAQIVKEANSTDHRFSCAVEKHGIPLSDGDCALSSLNPYVGYSIPQGDGAQERVDQYVENAGELMSNFVRDTNGDETWDTGVIIMGIAFDMANTDITPRSDPKGISEENPSGVIRDHKAFVAHAKSLLENASASECEICGRTYQNPVSTMDKGRLDVIPQRQAVTVTGLTPVLHDVSDAIYLELVNTMLPVSLLLVALAMLILHRNAKVIVICGLPIVMSLAITFGTTVILDIMLTPMIISAGPILVGLGVDYALHLTNRIEENRTELLDSRKEEEWVANRGGVEIEELDPFDPEISLKATVMAAMTTGNAIFLSALTTIIGFSVLTWPELVPIQPMRTVGITLLLGIACTFALSMLMVPALIELLKYRRGEATSLFKTGNIEGRRRHRQAARAMNTALGRPVSVPSSAAVATARGEYTVMGVNGVLFAVLSTGASSGILYWLASLTIGGAIILGITLSLTLTLSLMDGLWESIGRVPLRATLLIILFSLGVTLGGVWIYNDELGKEITGASDEVPPGLESYEALREYSIVFEGGQTNMFIVDASERGPKNDTAPIRDLPILDAIDHMQVMKIDNVANTTTISLVDILKAVHVDLEVEGLEIYDRSLWELIHDECWDESTNPLRPDCWPYAASSREDMVNIAFDTLSPEVRSMLMNADQGQGETKTLVYVNQPYINLATAGSLRDAIDGHLDGNGCASALDCPALGIFGVSNSLLTGGLPVSLDINKGIHDAQSETTIATMAILLLTMAILFRSPRLAIFTMTAVGVVVLWQPLLMRGGSVNVNVFTAMIGTIVFGIGVDDSIHIIDRIKDEGETPAGIAKSVSRTGHTIFETTSTTCAGLAAGLFVSVPGLQNFFVLMMLLLVLALLTSSILLPTMIVAYHELSSRLKGEGTWLDFEESGSLAPGPVLDAVLTD